MDCERLFCDKCGKQLLTIDEIEFGICDICKGSIKKANTNKAFLCWACNSELATMEEIAQGICHNCKAYITRGLRQPCIVKKSLYPFFET
ncbi:MAG: hypothetical protein ACOC80_02795 [Petrotogales bacterium]